ncbi:starch-binding protein [bacterium]|nr:starch-binding protein [bacterium]
MRIFKTIPAILIVFLTSCFGGESDSIVEPPTINPKSGNYETGNIITILPKNSKDKIYYTVDNRPPTKDTNLYTEPFRLNTKGEFTIKAASYRDGKNSEIASEKYIITEKLANGLRVYFKKPLDWDGAYIYFWNTSPSIPNFNWPGVEMSKIDNFWYTYVLEGVSESFIVFNDTKGKQSIDLFRDSDGWYYKGEWYNSKPKIEANFTISPSIESPEIYLTTKDSLTIQIRVELDQNLLYKYSWEPQNAKTEGTELTIELTEIEFNLDNNGVKTLQIYGTNGENEIIKKFNYQKKEDLVSLKKSEWNRLIVYQIMVEAFQNGDNSINYSDGYGPSAHKGDLRGIIDALPYIASLNVNAIWLTPIFDSEGDSKLDATGYFTRNYFAIDPKFGTIDDAKELVEKAHNLGLYVFFDGVFGHHKGDVKASPNGKKPQGGNNPVDYNSAETLEFYKEVATYWINQLDIDGWRLDQAYQVPISAWKEIRESVEALCEQRKQSGKTWGVLGYMVGEIWRGESEIQSQCYGSTSQKGLESCFDFPVRYSLVQVLATQENTNESWAKAQNASIINDAMNRHNLYSDHAQPNLMIGNHDLVRFGDLIQRAGLDGKESDSYWRRYQSILSFLAAYTGPITIYYNEEIGAEVDGFINQGDRGLYDDHASRSDGKTSNFTEKEESLKTYISKILQIRKNNRALYDGDREHIYSDKNLYIDYKKYENSQIIYTLNASTTDLEYRLECSKFSCKNIENLVSEEIITPQSGYYNILIPQLSGQFYKIKDN